MTDTSDVASAHLFSSNPPPPRMPSPRRRADVGPRAELRAEVQSTGQLVEALRLQVFSIGRCDAEAELERAYSRALLTEVEAEKAWREARKASDAAREALLSERARSVAAMVEGASPG